MSECIHENCPFSKKIQMFKTPSRIAGSLISKIKKRTPEVIKKNLGKKKASTKHWSKALNFKFNLQ
jgi:hypothetical protein